MELRPIPVRMSRRGRLTLLRVRSRAPGLLAEPPTTVKSLVFSACRLEPRMKASRVRQSIPRRWYRLALMPLRTMSLGGLTTRRPTHMNYYPACKAASYWCTHPLLRSLVLAAVRTAAMAVLHGILTRWDQIRYLSLGIFRNRPASFC